VEGAELAAFMECWREYMQVSEGFIGETKVKNCLHCLHSSMFGCLVDRIDKLLTCFTYPTLR